MKRSKLIFSLAIAGLGLGILVGCGGGGSSGTDDGGTAAATAQLSPQNVNKFVQSVSDEVGCTYTQSQNAATLRSTTTILPVGEILADVSGMLKSRGIDSSNLRVQLRETQVTNGSCGGTLTTTTSADGKSGTYVFKNYCNTTSAGTKSYTNGTFALSTSTSGQSMTLNFSTSTPVRMTSTNPNTGKKVDTTLNISGGRFYSSDGNLALGAENTSGTKTLSISSISIKDNVTGEGYSFQNVNVRMNGSSTTFSASYTDPELGVVTLSSNGDIGSKNGTITITGAGGQTAVISSGSTEGVFNVTSEGTNLGVMDCSEALVNSNL